MAMIFFQHSDQDGGRLNRSVFERDFPRNQFKKRKAFLPNFVVEGSVCLRKGKAEHRTGIVTHFSNIKEERGEFCQDVDVVLNNLTIMIRGELF